MTMTRRQFMQASGTATAVALLAGCAQTADEAATDETVSAGASTETSGQSSTLAFDGAAWSYNAEDDVYYQMGVAYCAKPADATLETLAIFVPGAYLTATDNGNGTFTCERNASGTVGTFTAETAPIVLPVNTPGYSSQTALDSYQSFTSFTRKGFVYVHAGCRGRDAGAPAGVTDLKAAVRFLRLASDQICGSTDRIFTFGMSGGGAQSALMGATGDAALFEPYLRAIGAAEGVSDAVFGSMDWCPITGLDVADEAYEWMMGCTREGLSAEEQAISDGLATAFAAYVNEVGIADEDGQTLRLEESTEGIYQAGTYYERVRAAIEESLEHFLADTTFPYDASSADAGGMGGPGFGGGGDGGRPSGEKPSGERPEGAPSGRGPEGGAGAAEGNDTTESNEFEARDDISRTQVSSGLSLSGTYETAAAYVEALNADDAWVSYDEVAGTVTITSVADFCKALKRASKSLAAFDQLDRGQGENTLFGVDGTPAHFDATLADVAEQVGSTHASDCRSDLALTDALGTDMATRVNMYTPLFFLLPSAKGFGTSEPARHWRIRSGIEQGDTALTTELNLALALTGDARVESVDFATVWGLGHTKAERTGLADDNFIAWVIEVA